MGSEAEAEDDFSFLDLTLPEAATVYAANLYTTSIGSDAACVHCTG